MSNIEWCINCVATGFITGTDNFIYNYQPVYAEQPDAMIIRQIVASTNVAGTATVTSLLTYNIFSDINNQIIGCVAFPYNCSGVANANNALTFMSNPNTYVQIYKPLSNAIKFQLIVPTGGSALPSPFSISIAFDLVKYKSK